jgi:hypothetical protein
VTRRQFIALALYLASCASICVAAVAYPRGAESLAWFALGGFLTLFALAAAVADTEWNR